MNYSQIIQVIFKAWKLIDFLFLRSVLKAILKLFFNLQFYTVDMKVTW